MAPASGRASGLGPTSPGAQSVGATVRLGKLVGGSAEANALIALVALEIGLQILMRKGVFRGAHGG